MNAITVPSKYDIIPIHTSDVGAFLRCRRYWDWTSPARNNLRRRVGLYGVNTNLWFGSGIHYALEMYYNPAIKRDPVEAFQTWFDIQWNGGIVTEDWLERVYDIDPIAVHSDPVVASLELSGIRMSAFDDEATLYQVKGLRDIHPDPDHEEFGQLRELGINMMEFYREWAPRNDDFEVISAESVFSIPLLDFNGKVLTYVDLRENSPNYGKELEVHARGKRDAVIVNINTERYGIIDYKTAAKIDESYFLKTENDPQCSNYMWASQEEARIWDLPYKVVEFIHYQAMWKKYPQPPTPLKDGITPSISRTDESATAQMFADYIAANGLTAWYEANPKAQAYYNFLVTEGDQRFINRHTVYRNQHELAQVGVELVMIAKDMLAPDVNIYKHASGDYLCVRCALRAPCLAKDDGSDWVDMLKSGYEVNRDR